MTARPPAFSTAAATASESVATTTSPTCAISALRITCTIIGSAADIGQRLAGQAGGGQAGRDQDDGIGHRDRRRPPGVTKSDGGAALIRVASGRQTGI